MSTVRERVAKGAALLDERQPRWRERINLAKLEMSQSDRCVLGQLRGDYFVGLYVWLDGPDPSEAKFSQWRMEDFPPALAHGFTAEREAWGTLTREWRRVIRREPS